MKIDVLVVGQGLAGTILAQTLLQRGLKIAVVDKFRAETSSKVAAGLLNPVAGKRVSLSWKADELAPFAFRFYQKFEQELSAQFFYPRPLVRLFSSFEDQNTWMGKSADPILARFIGVTSDDCLPDQINKSFGAMQVNEAGFVDLKRMLSEFRKLLAEKELLLDEDFDYPELKLTETGATYRNLQATTVIFCEGYRVLQNPWFSWLPVVPTKGEVLDLENPGLNLSCLYNKAVYMVPLGPGKVRVGATYDWRNPTEEPTDAGREELTAKAQDIVTLPLTVTAHKAGIRPAVRDRKPLVGRHPQHSQLVTFNGMGSKGVLMAPFFAHQLTEMLFSGGNLYREVAISRYYSLFPASN